MTIAIDLDEHALSVLRAEAEAGGEPDPETLARKVLLQFVEAHAKMTRGERAVARMQRVPTNGVTADEIMQMTRSEV